MSQYRKITVFVLSTIFITNFALAMESGDSEEGSKGISAPLPKAEPTTEELEEQLKRLKLQREIEEEKQRLTTLQSGGTPDKSLVEQLTGRSEDRVAHNIGREAEKGTKKVLKALSGKKHKKKDKKGK